MPSLPWAQVEIAMVCFFGLLAALTLAYIGRNTFADYSRGGRPAVPLGGNENSNITRDKLGAVSSLSSVCSQIGVDLLKVGGNAADAMLGTQFCIGVIGVHVSGLGGGGFMLVRATNASYEFVDFRETAPAAAFQGMFVENIAASETGGLASGVPGELRGLRYLYDHYASLPWKDLIRPSIKIARHGFRVGADLAYQMDLLGPSSYLVEDPTWAIDFAPYGKRVGVGDTMTRKRYADLLEAVAEDGPDAFYQGPIAETTIAALTAASGIMTLQDLKEYKVTTRQPLVSTHRDYKLVTCGAPSSGAVVLNVMKTVEGFPRFGDGGALDTHRLDEAIRFGYGLRTKLGDPSFLENVTAFEKKLFLDSTAAEIRGVISDTHTLPVASYDPEGLESLETPGTSHVVVADASGMAISLTSTVNQLFGSGLMVPQTGLIMNNEMNDFSVPNETNAFGYIPSPANFVRPGKRPLSSMVPLIVERLTDGALYVALGAAGGSKIITGVIQTLSNMLDRNKTAPAALASPRFHDQLVPNQIMFEWVFDNKTTAYMERLGHDVSWLEPSEQAKVQSLRRLPNGTFEAASEPRLADAGGFAA